MSRVIAAALSVLLVALAWTLVALLGVPGILAAGVTILIGAGWAAAFGWRRWRDRRAARDIDAALEAQADGEAQAARPDQRPEIRQMQAEFARAVDALKRSKLARRGRDALAVLPWYVIIGPPGAGKSTALRASGLNFPYLTQRGGVRGMGGTRRCEWWLTNEGVLLDTAGRYVTQEEDREEWTSFLEAIARARPRTPIDGLIVAISIVELGGETQDGAAELGRRMRERVDEVIAQLQVTLPIYLLLTKCDLLPGFVETFADLRRSDRGQVWGFTVPVSAVAGGRELFRDRLDRLLCALEERTLRRMGEERQLRARERIYEFPQQLEAAKAPLTAFLEALLAENVYQDVPILRGLYFTSGTQEGRLVDRVMTSMAEAFGVRPRLPDPEPVLEAKSYFLRDVFAKVLFPDRGIAGRNATAVRREVLRKRVLVGAACAVSALALLLPLRSYSRNRALAASTAALAEDASKALGRAPQAALPLAELERLRERLELLERHAEEGAPLSMRFGLYAGDALLAPVRRLFGGAIRGLLIVPAFRQGREELEEFTRRLEASPARPDPSEQARHHASLELHLLLTAPRERSEPQVGEPARAFIGRAVADRWAARLGPGLDRAVPAIEASASLFGKLLGADPTLALPRDEELVRRVRRVLRRVPASDLAVEKLALELDGRGYDLDLDRLLERPTIALRAESKVRGAFTRRAYVEVVRRRLESLAAPPDAWVLGPDGDAERDASGDPVRVRMRYFQRYVEAWQRLVDSLAVQPLSAIPLLQELTAGEPPPYAQLLGGIAYNTRLTEADATDALAGGLVGRAAARVRAALGAAPEAAAVGAERGGAGRFGPSEVQAHFAGLVAFGRAPGVEEQAASPGGGAGRAKAPLDAYQEQLAFVRDALLAARDEPQGGGVLREALSRARTSAQGLIDSREIGWRPRLQALLLPPIDAGAAEAAEQAGRVAAARWCSEVALFWRSHLAGRYPFRRNGTEDASLTDVAEFFRRDSGRLWSFYAQALSRDVESTPRGHELRRQRAAPALRKDLLAFLDRAAEITAALFPPGAPEPSVQLWARIRPTPGVARASLEIDGQRLDYRNGPEEWRRLAWPNAGKLPGASLRVELPGGSEEVIDRAGEWGLFRLLEAGALKGSPRGRDFTLAFEMRSLGVSVPVDFRAARGDAPFFGAGPAGAAQLFGPFRAADAAPLGVAVRGAACGDAFAARR